MMMELFLMGTGINGININYHISLDLFTWEKAES